MSPARRHLAAGLVMAMLALPACRAPKDSGPPPVPGAHRQHQGVTLDFYGLAPELVPPDEQWLIAAFEEATGISIATHPMPEQSEEAYLVLQRLAATGAIDVMTLDVIWTGAFAEFLKELGPEFAEAAKAHFPAARASGMHGGKFLAMPLYATVGMLFSRSDLLAAYGYTAPPATWQELEAMARAIQDGERQKAPGFCGFVWPGGPLEALTCFGLEVQWSHGAGSFIDMTTRQPNVTSPQALAAYRRAQGWVGTISPSSVTSYPTPSADHVFREGYSAFLRSWATSYADFASSGSPIHDKFTLSDLPHAQGPSAGTLGGWMLGISRRTAHPEAASLYVRYMTSPEVQAWRAMRNGTPPTLPDLYRDAALLEAQPHLSMVEPSIRKAILRPSGGMGDRYKTVSQVYYQGWSAMLRGSPPESVAPLMRDDLAKLLSR